MDPFQFIPEHVLTKEIWTRDQVYHAYFNNYQLVHGNISVYLKQEQDHFLLIDTHNNFKRKLRLYSGDPVSFWNYNFEEFFSYSFYSKDSCEFDFQELFFDLQLNLNNVQLICNLEYFDTSLMINTIERKYSMSLIKAYSFQF